MTDDHHDDEMDGGGVDPDGLWSGLDEGVLAAMGVAVPRPMDWSGLSATARREELVRLWGWVVELAGTWPVPSDVVPPCWYRHESLIRILSACRDAYLTMYGGAQLASAAADWMTVWDATEQRLRHWVRVTGCNAQRHRDDMIQRWITDPHTAAEARAEFGRFVDDEYQRRSTAELNNTTGSGTP